MREHAPSSLEQAPETCFLCLIFGVAAKRSRVSVGTTDVPQNGHIKYHLAWSALVSVVCSLIIITIFYFYFANYAADKVMYPANCYESSLKTICFFDRSSSSFDIISVITSFYTNIIVILIAIITIVAALVALSMKYTTRVHAEAELPVVTKSLFDADAGREILKNVTNVQFASINNEINNLNSRQKDMQEIQNALVEKYERFQERFESVDLGAMVLSKSSGVEEEE